MYTVTRTLADGTTKTRDFTTKRLAGQHVAYCLHDNANYTRKDATRAAMDFERTGTLTTPEYTFTLTKRGGTQ
jgi:hypothetical protein